MKFGIGEVMLTLVEVSVWSLNWKFAAAVNSALGLMILSDIAYKRPVESKEDV